MARQDERMNVGTVARTTGAGTCAARYDEQERLLAPTMRNGAGCRLSDGEACERGKCGGAARALAILVALLGFTQTAQAQ